MTQSLRARPMTLLDILLLFIVFAFGMFGLFFGFIHTLGSLVGTLASVYLTSRWFHPLYDRYGFIVGSGFFSQLGFFLIAFLIISRVVGIAFWLVEKIVKIIKFIPFVTTADRLLGGVLGLIEGFVIATAIVFAMSWLLPDAIEQAWIGADGVARTLLDSSGWIGWLLPEAMRWLP